jgi:predicted  nucleic acid-binding Zn-ribbon protein
VLHAHKELFLTTVHPLVLLCIRVSLVAYPLINRTLHKYVEVSFGRTPRSSMNLLSVDFSALPRRDIRHKEPEMKIIETLCIQFRLTHKLAGAILLTVLLALGSAARAEDQTPAPWVPYEDRFGLFHSIKVDSAGDPMGNGLLYTGEACLMMQLRGVAFDRNRIASGLEKSQVSKGLFRTDPTNDHDQASVDDYIGLGALAGICGYSEVARDILSYGAGIDQTPPESVLSLNVIDQGRGWLSIIRKGVPRPQLGHILPYNYNNVDSGKFTLSSWMGRYPAVIVQWKMAAGYQPSQADFNVWCAALDYSKSKFANSASNPQNRWLQSWLMILTYEMSPYHSRAADTVVGEWWAELHRQYPDGMKQVMKDYLGTGWTADNPFYEFIEDFKDARNSSARIVDDGAVDIATVDSLGGLFSMDCASSISDTPCIADRDFVPTDFLSPLNATLSSAQKAFSAAQTAVATQQEQVRIAEVAVKKAGDGLAELSREQANLQAQSNDLQQRLTNETARKAEMLARGLDKIPLVPGHWFVPTKKVFGKRVPIGPPVWIPGKNKPNPAFEDLVRSMTDLNNSITDARNKLAQGNQEIASTQRELKVASDTLASANTQLNRLQSALSTAQADVAVAAGAVQYAESLVENILPGMQMQ